MSNPYAPPEDRPRTDDGAAPQPTPVPGPPAHAPDGRPPLVPVPTEAPRERREPDPAEVLRTAQRARTAGVLLVASVLVVGLPVPWQAAALPFALAAFVLGIRALVGAVRSRAQGALPAVLALLVGLAGMWVSLTAGTLLMWQVQTAHQECMAGALTVTAQQRCQDALDEGRLDLQRSLLERAQQG